MPTNLSLLPMDANEKIHTAIKPMSILLSRIDQDKAFADDFFHAVEIEDNVKAKSLAIKAGIPAETVTTKSNATKTSAGKVAGGGSVCIDIGKWEFCFSVKVKSATP